jgi:UDP-glucose 4-epimerase
MHILVTGGAGYIGSHACLELLNAGYQVTVVDSLVNSKEISLHRVQELTGKSLAFHHVDLLDRPALEAVFRMDSFDAVMHFAGLKAVGESVSIPLRYYYNNITSTAQLCEVMAHHHVKNLIFSSSAVVYGEPASVPIREDFPVHQQFSPYGRTKRMIEQILQDLVVSDPQWNITMLRYFNPVGAHPSGRIGEDPRGTPNNLLPYIAQVAVGRHSYVRVWGDDYPTPDGTGIRDYIHVLDLVQGHLKALEKQTHNQLNSKPGLEIYNLGTNRGFSVLELISAFEKACGKRIPYKVFERRSGDVAVSYADASKANAELGWSSQRGLAEICQDAWRWQSNNPNGYD